MPRRTTSSYRNIFALTAFTSPVTTKPENAREDWVTQTKKEQKVTRKKKIKEKIDNPHSRRHMIDMPLPREIKCELEVNSLSLFASPT